ncbi:uncharacterized protein LOC132162906 [Corylus avellana]|uniref:uncharacterized protein LOC132162906 n=1 Tax=Corylus avellana TaxID=13451 RepID=UPI00286C5482|nr:uncharacterized protein LOC132162906 [Corylus avellana]
MDTAVLLRKLPPKLKDPGSFTTPCRIGDHLFYRALLDLGVGVNLLPYNVYEMLGLGELQPTSITLQLVDRSIKRPKGIPKDVLIKVDQFILPAEFIVLDMEECPMPLPLPIILGRPFMRIADNKNLCEKGCCQYGGVVEKVLQVHHIDPLEATLTYSITQQDIKPDFEDVTDGIIEAVHLLESSPQHPSKYPAPFETLVPTNTTFFPSIVKAPKLELKQLLENLTYAYLGENQTLPVTVAANLSLGEEEKLLRVLRKHKTTLGWTIADIKEISPAKCMHQMGKSSSGSAKEEWNHSGEE